MHKETARWHKSIHEIPKASWNILAGNETNPFYRWEWLQALEYSESVSNKQGWQPLHLVIWRNKSPIAIAPLYIKYHSYGEFIFDQAFSKLAEEIGLSYYPKLIGMSPLSPVEGYQFFYGAGENKERLTSLMLQIIDQFAIKNKILSCNFLYVDEKWRHLVEVNGYTKWINQKSLWLREDVNDFSGYLSRFNSNQRRNIKRERKSVTNTGIKTTAITGQQVTKTIMKTMHDLYEQHCSKWGPWGSKYLNRQFFEAISESKVKDQVVLFSAHRGDPQDPLAMSFCIRNENMLWGRYWGSKEEIKSLHFEVCYYSPIAWSIENGINSFDPGAGGSHKLRRGFMAQPNISLHRWYDQRMKVIIRQWLNEINQVVLKEINSINADLPFINSLNKPS